MDSAPSMSISAWETRVPRASTSVWLALSAMAASAPSMSISAWETREPRASTSVWDALRVMAAAFASMSISAWPMRVVRSSTVVWLALAFTSLFMTWSTPWLLVPGPWKRLYSLAPLWGSSSMPVSHRSTRPVPSRLSTAFLTIIAQCSMSLVELPPPRLAFLAVALALLAAVCTLARLSVNLARRLASSTVTCSGSPSRSG